MSEAARWSLGKLEASILLAPGFPRRITYTRPQYLELKARSTNVYTPGLEAIERAGDQVQHLRNLVEQLGRERYEPSVPTLARLWKDCALQPVWVAVGHALLAIGTPEAMAALLSSLEDQEYFAQHMAFKAAFARGSSAAFDYLNARFGIADGKHWILVHVLDFLRDGGIGLEPKDLMSDPRWLDLCARHRRHSEVGHAAREVLRIATAMERARALRDAKAAEAPPAPPRVQRDGMLLKRYLSGEFEQVWRDIRANERIDGAFREEVIEVAEAAMRRVAQNADLIAERLRALGWQALLDDLRTLPKPSDQAVLARIAEVSAAPIPPTLLAFWHVVGGINWVWDYDASVAQPDLGFELPLEEHDALCVHAPAAVADLIEEFEEWIDEKEQFEADLVHPFRIFLAPDYLHKANYSGGGPYCIEVPFLGADPLFADERHGLPFLDYLRLAFRWAGFPGLDQHAGRRDVRNFVDRFGEGLIPF